MLSLRCFERVHFCNHLVGQEAAIAAALEQTVTFLAPRMMITVLLAVAGLALIPLFFIHQREQSERHGDPTRLPV